MHSDADLTHAAATLGRKGGQATSEAKRAAARANGAKGGRPRTHVMIYVAVARFGGRDGGIIAFGRTKAECQARAWKTGHAFSVRRERTSIATVEALTRVGKL